MNHLYSNSSENFGGGTAMQVFGGTRDSRDFESRSLTSHIPSPHAQSQSYGVMNNSLRDLDFSSQTAPSSSYGTSSNQAYFNNANTNSSNTYTNYMNGNQARYPENQDNMSYQRVGAQSMPMNFTSGQNFSRSSKNNMGIVPSPNVGNEPSQQSQQYRHARRIYLGGIPPNYADEEALKNFLNNVISKGLGEENDHSYVVSIYINQKKCFAFVELKSVELATACLDLDGIIYKKVILKVLRAKEYQPELLPPSFLNKTLRFDLTSFAFGCPATPAYSSNSNEGKEYQDAKLDSLIQFSNLTAVTRGAVVIVGFPFDDNVPGTPSLRGKANTAQGANRGIASTGSTNAAKYFRNSIHKSKFGTVDNPEYAIDLGVIKMFDVGDVLAGKNGEETKMNLTATVTELIVRGGIPFVVGGSSDQTYYNAMGLISACGSNNVGVMCISAQLDTRLVFDPKFCQQKAGVSTCEGRYIRFAAQGSQCSQEVSTCVTERGGQIVWYGKHLRNPASKYSAPYQFKKFLAALSLSASGISRPVYVSLDIGAMCGSAIPQSNSSNSPLGLTIDEVMDMAMIAGANPNVVLFDVVEFIPSSEDSRQNLLVAEIYYKFSLGVASRVYVQLQEQQHGLYSTGTNSLASSVAGIDDTSSVKSEGKTGTGATGLITSNTSGSMSSLAKMSLQKQSGPSTSTLSSSAPEYPAPLSMEPFLQQQQSSSGKHQSPPQGSGGRFPPGPPAHTQQPSLASFGSFGSGSHVGSEDLGGEIGDPYGAYFDGSAPLEMGGGNYFSSGGFPQSGGLRIQVRSDSISKLDTAFLPQGYSSSSAINSPSNASFSSGGALAAAPNQSGKLKKTNQQHQMMFGFGSMESGLNMGLMGTGTYQDSLNGADSGLYGTQQFGGLDQQRFGSHGMNLATESNSGTTTPVSFSSGGGGGGGNGPQYLHSHGSNNAANSLHMSMNELHTNFMNAVEVGGGDSNSHHSDGRREGEI